MDKRLKRAIAFEKARAATPEQSLTLLADSRVSMLTFGGKQFWTAKAGEDFPFSFVVEANPAYVVVQSGLNFYIFETAQVKFAEGVILPGAAKKD
jgi:hypothetical protein